MPRRKSKAKSENSRKDRLERVEELRAMVSKTDAERRELRQLEGELEAENDQRTNY